MNILVLNYEYPPLGGGGGVATKELVEGFVAHGHTCYIVTSAWRLAPKREVNDGEIVYRVPIVGARTKQAAGLLSMVSYVLVACIVAYRLSRRVKFDWINTHFAVPTGPSGLLLSRLLRVPNVLSVHGGDIFDPSKRMSPHRWALFRSIVTAVAKRASWIIVQSRNTAENLHKFYPRVSKDRVRRVSLAHVPANYDPLSRKALGMRDDRIYVIGVGRLVSRKDYQTFVRAISLLPAQFHGIIIGDGPARSSILNLINDMDISQRVTLTGSVSHELKMQYMYASDIYLLSSLHEGFGIVLQEAMEVGLPIVATDQGGQTDIAEFNRFMRLVPVADIQAMANEIQQLAIINTSATRREIATYIERYHPDAIAAQYLHLVKQL